MKPKLKIHKPFMLSSTPIKERRDRVISYRVTPSVADALQKMVTAQGDPRGTAENLARKLMMDSLPPGLANATFKMSLTDTIPAFDIVVGDAASTLRHVRANVVDTIVTSPPYFKMRRYSDDHREIGRERTPEEYVCRLVEVFRECQRVLKPEGTLWVVIDDAYHQKQLLGLPWKLMSALQADGWIVRGEQIWHKRGMPEGVHDRTTRDHEFVFLLSKQKRYFYDTDAVREPFESKWSEDCLKKAQARGVTTRPSTNPFSKQERHEKSQRGISRAEYGALLHPGGRNRRSVWQITTEKLKDAHYAPFPVSLADICIRAGSRIGGLVLDPFAGAGSTGIAALQLGRKFLGIELVEQFAEISRRRIANVQPCCGTFPSDVEFTPGF